MRDEMNSEDAGHDPTPLDRRLHAIDPPSLPDDLLDRCLATVPKRDRPAAAGRRSLAGWGRRAAAAVAALLLIGITALVARPRPADGASLLQDVRKALGKVAASHRVTVRSTPDGTRREEVWFARDRGRREDIRVNNQLIALVVRNQRWEFRWDVPGRLVAAWSTELNAGHPGLNADGPVMDLDEMVRWAESHRAEVKVESDTIDGRKLRKLTLKWPGPPNDGFLPRTELIWFDPELLRPVKHLVEYDNGKSLEMRIDYPAPESVPDDLFELSPPPDVTIEINDPDLGRQIYSEARTQTSQPPMNAQPGVKP